MLTCFFLQFESESTLNRVKRASFNRVKRASLNEIRVKHSISINDLNEWFRWECKNIARQQDYEG